MSIASSGVGKGLGGRPSRQAAGSRGKSIGLFFDPQALRDEEFLRGIFSYTHDMKVGWDLHPAASGEIFNEHARRMIRLDGIIISAERPNWASAIHAVQAHHTPGVIMAFPPAGSTLAGVLPDNYAIGRLAAEHFLRRAFRSFAFYGLDDNYPISRERLEGFRAALTPAGHDALTYRFRDQEAITATGRNPARLAAWLEALPKPVAIMAVADDRARHVSVSCRRLGLCVPEEVAICGSDDTAICQTDSPWLSSVQLDRQRAGYAAAEMLDRMLHGEPAQALRIAPRGIAVRQSSDIFAVADLEVQSAMRWIHQHSNRPMRVEQVVGAVVISRTSLEQKFRRALGRTIQDEIWQAHVERAKRLLIESDDELSVIARESGFRNSFRLCQVFRQRTGQTPGECRQARLHVYHE